MQDEEVKVPYYLQSAETDDDRSFRKTFKKCKNFTFFWGNKKMQITFSKNAEN
jgi:hypothetical protein